jgi:hypothetical protein
MSDDADGNLDQGRLLGPKWDAENCLTRMEPNATFPDGAIKKLLFTYDYMGRRISKTVSNYSSGSWSFGYTRKFVYDGWNPVIEMDGNNNGQIAIKVYIPSRGNVSGETCERIMEEVRTKTIKSGAIRRNAGQHPH